MDEKIIRKIREVGYKLAITKSNDIGPIPEEVQANINSQEASYGFFIGIYWVLGMIDQKKEQKEE